MNFEKIKEIFSYELKPDSLRQYIWHLERYNTFLLKQGLVVDKVSEPFQTIQDYIQNQSIAEKWSKSMVNLSFYAIKRYWEKIRGIEVNRKFFTNTGHETGHEPHILDRNEVDLIFTKASSLEPVEETMIHVGWEAALRTGELVTLKGGNFWSDGTLEVRVLKTDDAKKRVPLSPETLRRVNSLAEGPTKHVFRHLITREQDNYTYRRRYIPSEWSGSFGQWTEGILKGGGIRWHDFARHTRLTHYAEDTRNFLAVLQLSGHQNPKVCRQYFERAKIDMPELEALGKQEWGWLK